MATVVNFIDTTLQAAAARTVNLPSAQILLTPSAPAFHVTTGGVNSPASITFTRTLIDLDGTVSFACTGGTLTNVTASSADLTYANMGGTSATVTASITVNGTTFSAPCTISKLYDGAAGASVTGPRGAGAFYATGSAWAGSTGDAIADAATPGANVVDDTVCISNGGTFALTKRWNGSAWVAQGQVIDGSLAVTGSFAAAAINTNGLYARKPDGTPIITIGGLQAGFEAPGTKNSDQTLGSLGFTGDTNATHGADSTNLNIGLANKNLLKNSLPSSVSGYTFSDNNAVGGTGPIYAGPNNDPSEFAAAFSPDGAGTVYMRGVGTPGVGTSMDIIKDFGSKAIVIAGRRYEVSVGLSTHRCKSQLMVRWYDSSNSLISVDAASGYEDNNQAGVALGSAFPRSRFFAVSPTGAAFAVLAVRQVHTGGTDCYTFTSQWHLGEALAAQTVFSPWSDSAVGTSKAVGSAQFAADAANAALTNKLDNNAANILSGGAGITAGTLTYNTSGTRTGGYGVAINSTGIVGFNSSGVATITINAATGSVAVLGDISGSTGTFSGSIRTGNYSEDGGGNPSAGVKLDAAGTALKVANNSFQVGTAIFSDYWFRLVQGIDGSIGAGKVIWRGNNDATSRSGTPNISCLSIIPISDQLVQSNFQQMYHSYKLTPTSYTSYSDNLDAMQQIHVQLFRTSTDTSPFTEFYQPCPSRTYNGTDGVAQGSWHWGWRYTGTGAVTSGALETNNVYSGYLRVRIANSYGFSATQDFSPGTAINTALTTTTITGVSGTGSSGGGGAGGACPAPWVKVMLINGKEVNAGDLHNGAVVAAVNDETMAPLPSGGVIRNISVIWAQRYRVKLADGTATEWSENHRFAVQGRGWVHVQHLQPGDHILGMKEGVVDTLLATGDGQVISFEVEGAGTYFAGGLLCHNYKQIP